MRLRPIWIALILLGTGRAPLSAAGAAPPSADAAASSIHDRREFLAQKRYLNLPVKNGAPKRVISLYSNGRLARQFEIELAEGAPDWRAFLDLRPFRGERMAIAAAPAPADSVVLRAITQSDSIIGAETLYHEKLRPQFHFSSRRGWNNDPNGLVYFQGEYHLFYQHNPYGWNWGNMHWGHAVSRDLTHWHELGDALYPDRFGTIFSGSAVVDWENTTGFGKPNAPAVVCIYTAAGGTSLQSKGAPFAQCLAYSADRGRSWTKYSGNPVLPHIVGDNRDPKVIWYEPAKEWVLALYLDKNDYGLFASPDLKRWRRLSDVSIPGTAECPEFFSIPIAGHPDERRWIFYGGNGRYLIGSFDGVRFVRESGPHSLNAGNCFYASQTFNQIPRADGRRILMPWGQINLPGMPFNQMIGLPVELTLRRTADGLRLFAYPVRELESLRRVRHSILGGPLNPGDNPLANIRGELLDIDSELAPGAAREIVFNVRGQRVVYDAARQALICGKNVAPLKTSGGILRLRILVDRAGMDIFGGAGEVYMPMNAICAPANRSLQLTARGGGARILKLDAYELGSAWQ